jgi:hypothetical protein
MAGDTWDNGTTFTGGGTMVVSNSATIPANVTVPVACNLSLGGGRITGAGGLQSSGGFTWTAGALEVATATVSGSLSITGMGEKSLTGTGLSLSGQTVWDGGEISLTGANIYNRGRFEIRTGSLMRALMGGASSFQNISDVQGRGTVTKTAGAGTTFDIAFITAGDLLFNGNAMRFQRGLTQTGDGSTDLASGVMDLADGVGGFTTYRIDGGTLTGGGTVTGNLWNTGGTVKLGQSGALRLNVGGDYTQVLSGALQVYASSNDTWGQLQVTGKANLDGTLQIPLGPGYLPAAGFQKNIIGAAGGVFGAFAPPLPGGWDILYIGADFVSVQKQ